MRWEDLFSDLEAQLVFSDWASVESDSAELTRGLWAETSLVDRLRGTVGHQIELTLVDGHRETLTVSTVGPTWIGGTGSTGSVLISLQALAGVDSELFSSRPPRSILRSGPSLASLYRMIARRREAVEVYSLRGEKIAEGTIDRVGKDHCDIALHSRDEFRRTGAVRGYRVVPFSAISMLRASAYALD